MEWILGSRKRSSRSVSIVPPIRLMTFSTGTGIAKVIIEIKMLVVVSVVSQRNSIDSDVQFLKASNLKLERAMDSENPQIVRVFCSPKGYHWNEEHDVTMIQIPGPWGKYEGSEKRCQGTRK